MTDESDAIVEVVGAMAEISQSGWDACANPPGVPFNPFISHAFLQALEEAETVHPRTGWQPQHLILRGADDRITGCMPLYAKSHSKGEYVFDYGWADAFERAGGSYYPKLVSAVPFTPVPGRRILVRPGPNLIERERFLLAGAVELVRRHDVSSLHINFLTEAQWETSAEAGFLQRTDQQFHWQNAGYATFDDFLASLASRKRKAVRKERAQAFASGLEIEWLSGSDITEAHWDAIHMFYMETGSRKWGRPFLNRTFFSLLGERMGEHCLLTMVSRNGNYIAGALNMIGGDCLYGRYWGAIEYHHCLHFEVCYYQAIAFAIQNKLDRVEAGAQGEHKLARGYMPTATYSTHYIPNPSFRRAIDAYLEDERSYVERSRQMLAEFAPYRRATDDSDQI
ncbi:MAG: GNAT family N-acetyltransferase [Hyphomicrobiaceae bacterium]